MVPWRHLISAEAKREGLSAGGRADALRMRRHQVRSLNKHLVCERLRGVHLDLVFSEKLGIRVLVEACKLLREILLALAWLLVHEHFRIVVQWLVECDRLSR